MNNWKRIGYVSIELVITASLIMAVGFFLLLNLGTTGSQIMQNGMAKLEDLGIFDGSGGNTPSTEVVFDENGYPKDLNIKPSDINPETDFEYKWDDDLNGWAITVYVGDNDDLDVVIPSRLSDGLPVVAIGIDGGIGANSWTSVVIPNTIKEIRDYAFYNCNLTGVIIPDSVTTIGVGAFWNNQLAYVKLSNKLNSLPKYSFSGNPLTSIIIPGNIKTIDKWAFGDSALETVVLEEGIETLEEYAFSNNNISNLSLPNSLRTIGQFAFTENELVNLDLPNSLTYIGNGAFSNNKIQTIVFGTGLLEIGMVAFRGNNLSGKLVFPDNLQIIGSASFLESELSEVVFGTGLRELHGGAFYGSALNKVTFKSSLSVAQTAFGENQNLTTGSVKVPNALLSEYQLLADQLGLSSDAISGY